MHSFITPTAPLLPVPAKASVARKPRAFPLCRNPPPRPPARKRNAPLSTAPPSPRLLQTVSRARPPPARALVAALRARRDALVVGAGLSGKISALLSAREPSEHALVLLPTREDTLRAAHEAALDARGSRVIVVAGHGPGSWARPAMNANSATHAVIVVGTPRAIARQFASGHGRPWLAEVRFLAVVDVERIVETACAKELGALLRALRPRKVRKNVVVAMREPQGWVAGLVERLLREKRDVVRWGGSVPIAALPRKELVRDARLGAKRQRFVSGSWEALYGVLRREVAQFRGKTGKMIVFFPTARLVECYATLLRGRDFEILDVHNKTPIARRDRLLDSFFRDETGVLFSTDTVTRDTVLPEIDIVLQVGLPESHEQYFRRLALVVEKRIGRYSMLLVGDVEREEALRRVKGASGDADGMEREEACLVWDSWNAEQGRSALNDQARCRAYQSWLAYYRMNRKKLGWEKRELVRIANEWAEATMGEVPVLDKKAVDKLFLRDVPGIRVRAAQVK